MSKQRKTMVAATIAVCLASAAVRADDAQPRGATKEQKWGMATGAATGALIGGPIGAGIGFIVGAITGSGIGEIKLAKQSVQSLESQLAAARTELAQMAAAQQAEQNTMIEQLAERLHADVLFRTASAELDATAAQKLADLGKVLGAYPDLFIDLDGYADPRGTSTANDELSQQRAMAVRAALVVGGLQPERIRVAAHGEKLSTATKDDMEAYAWERRVSVSVTTGKPAQVAQAK